MITIYRYQRLYKNTISEIIRQQVFEKIFSEDFISLEQIII